MEKIISGLVLVLLVGLLLNCASPPTTTNPYRPLSGIPNANVLGIIQADFESNFGTELGGSRGYIDRISEEAYAALMGTAKKDYNGNIDIVDITYVQKGLRGKYQYTATGKVVSLGRSSRSMATGVEGALARAAQETLKNVQAKSKIAIVYITAQDKSTTEYIAGELEFIWVNAGFVIIDRSQLDRIRREQNFQMSGEVDDNTAVSIGKIIGANIIVTGRVDGEGNLRRLRLRALDTQTAQVVGVASERL